MRLSQSLDDQFRIVVVEPGTGDDPLSAQLWLTDLDHTSKGIFYQAVSHSWYPDDAEKEISSNDWPTKISSSLHELLQFNGNEEYKKNPEGGLGYWIDKICINQADEQDKAQQIPYMRAIYEKSNAILVWLGPAADDSDLAIDLIQQLVSTHTTGIPAASKLLDLDNPELMKSWQALAAFLQRPYWNRTWILQEATANMSNEFVLCGTKKCALASILNVGLDIKTLVETGQAPEFIVNNVASSMVLRIKNFLNFRRPDEQHKVNLFRLLDIARRTECSDPRDKVYSMLSFAADFTRTTNKSYLEITYKEPTFGVYSNVVKWYIATYGNLDFLGSCFSVKSSILDYYISMPSCVPNWTLASFSKPLRKRTSVVDPSTPRLYRAGGPHSEGLKFNLEPPDQPHTLLIDGMKIATVVQLLDAAGIDWPALTSERSWQDHIEPDQQYCLTGESMQDAFHRTIVADAEFVDGVETVKRNAYGNMDPASSSMTQIDNLKHVTTNRCLFFAGASVGDHVGQSDLLMGLCRDDVQVGDEVWALKGGSVLYVLRFRDMFATNNVGKPEPGQGHANLLCVNEKKRAWDETIVADRFTFAGEAYVHGLMDGEALGYATKSAECRALSLNELESGFREIFIGGYDVHDDAFL